MDLIHGYKTSKQNSALLEIFTKSFPGNAQITQGLEQLLNKNESTIARLKKLWQSRKKPIHDEQSINLLNAQEKLERQRENAMSLTTKERTRQTYRFGSSTLFCLSL